MAFAAFGLPVKRDPLLRTLERRRAAERRRGFTLIELLAVVAIISVLAALASPAFVRLIRDQRVNRAALEIADLTRTARTRALGRGTAVIMRWTASGTTGLVEVREAVAAGADLLPAPSCANADFKDSGLTSREVTSLNFGNGAYELADISFFDIAGTKQTSPEICFSPRGQTYYRTDSASTFQPLAGVPYFTLDELEDGLRADRVPATERRREGRAVSRLRSRRAARGYTIMEVMTAVCVLGLGAAGVIAMQKSTQVANYNARMLATGSAVAQSWIEHLREDGLVWNNPGGTSDLTDTTWLSLSTSGTPGTWVRPTAITNTASSAADIHGDDIADSQNVVAVFCTQIAVFPLYDGVVGVKVRTLWSRFGEQIKCQNFVGTEPDPANIGAVYYSTAVINNVLPGG